ncbi:hypothetical protein [Paenibacillus rigui]|uniref:Uncharacterized protein n=1 Tax=Paenibacillus rigui TaxID=554312 RepID=A0A229UML5_9BACL|nr:hypothetical protein [Paenibacillus rigui]OXM84611.1 hypothetical protein CF651_19080 [Paenibacillus rigui]
MSSFSDQRRTIEDMLPQSPIVFATIAAVDPGNRMLKIMIEPWGTESGWCKVLKDTFYPIPFHLIGGTTYTHEPQWPYKVDQEVLAAVVRGAQGTEQYVVLGLLDEGLVSEQ